MSNCFGNAHKQQFCGLKALQTGLTLEAYKDQRIPQLHGPMQRPNVPTIAKTAESNDLGHDPNDEFLCISCFYSFLKKTPS